MLILTLTAGTSCF